MSHQPRFYAVPNFLKVGYKLPKYIVFWTISTINDEKSAAKFHYITRMWANAQPDGRLPNIGGALCSTPQSLADAHY